MRLAAFIVVIVASYYGARYWTTHVVRYRLTVEIDTPDGVKSGSSVIEVRWEKNFIRIAGVPPYNTSVKGEAVFVDLGDGKNVVALLANGTKGDGVDYPFNLTGMMDSSLQKVWDLLPGAAVDLKPPQIPTIVTFMNLAEPLSVHVLYATENVETTEKRDLNENSGGIATPGISSTVTVNDFRNIFGTGYGFRRAGIEIVPASTPLTVGILDKVPLLVTYGSELKRVLRNMPPRFQLTYTQLQRG